jgi:hypothetical protein
MEVDIETEIRTRCKPGDFVRLLTGEGEAVAGRIESLDPAGLTLKQAEAIWRPDREGKFIPELVCRDLFVPYSLVRQFAKEIP